MKRKEEFAKFMETSDRLTELALQEIEESHWRDHGPPPKFVIPKINVYNGVQLTIFFTTGISWHIILNYLMCPVFPYTGRH
jgi:hypothetical protein